MVTKFNSHAWLLSGLSCKRLKEELKPCTIVYRILATKFATAFGGRASFTNPSGIPTVPPSNDDSYWCALTQRVLGPDGQLVEPQSCKPGRACFKEAF